jgi:hypothetical protein
MVHIHPDRELRETRECEREETRGETEIKEGNNSVRGGEGGGGGRWERKDEWEVGEKREGGKKEVKICVAFGGFGLRRTAGAPRAVPFSVAPSVGVRW